MGSEIYKVTILNFFKHNPKSRKSFTHFMVAKNYFHDAKISQLTPNESQLFLYCCAIACDLVSDQFEINAKSIPKQFRISCKSLAKHLERLQSLQLLTYDKIGSLYNIREENIREEKRIEVPKGSAVPKNSDKELNSKIWETYKGAYFHRYGTEPVRNGSVNSKISQIAKRLGSDAVEVVSFFLTHNDQFYVKQLHQIGLCLKDAESLHTQWKRGKAITSRDVKTFEQRQNISDLHRAINEGTI